MQLSAIQNKIYEIRGHKVMLDRDLAEMYDVETRVLNQAGKRNEDRFPPDFMFQLTSKEFENWKSQIVISKSEQMGLRKPSFAFTEQGVSMLSGVLNSKKAIAVNITIIRTFVLLRQYTLINKDLSEKIKALEKKYNKNFKAIFKALEYLIAEKQNEKEFSKRGRIGFKP